MAVGGRVYEFAFPVLKDPDVVREGGFAFVPRNFRQEVKIRSDLQRRLGGEPTEEEVMLELIRWSLRFKLVPDGTLPKRTVANPYYNALAAAVATEAGKKYDVPATLQMDGLTREPLTIEDGTVDVWLDGLTGAEALLVTRAYTDVTTPLTVTQVRDFLKGRKVTEG